jgi:hypothetical protein
MSIIKQVVIGDTIYQLTLIECDYDENKNLYEKWKICKFNLNEIC